MMVSVKNLSTLDGGHVLLEDVSWETYESLLNDIGDGNTRVTYDEGRMEIMSPLAKHERGKKRIGRMIEAMTEELGIPCGSMGSTTFKSQRRNKGLEPDECYYIANEKAVRDKEEIDLNIDPPPDLAVEIDISYRAIKRASIYSALGVPEVWLYDGKKIECLWLNSKKEYDVMEFSRAFPFLKPAELVRFLQMIPKVDEGTMIGAFREWVVTLKR